MAERLSGYEGGVAVLFQHYGSACVAGRRVEVVNVVVLYSGMASVRDSLSRLKVVGRYANQTNA